MKTISTANAPAAIGPYAQGNIAGGLLFASGQIPLDPETGEIVGSTIEEQTAQVMKNVAAILEVRPARSAVAVEKLPKGALVEVEVIAEVN